MNAEYGLQRQIGAALTIVETATACASQLRGASSDHAVVYAISLHATITELFAGCLALARAERPAGIPILVRAMFEAFVDLENLLRDANYYKRMDAVNLQRLLRLLAEASTNPLFTGLNDLPDVEQYRKEFSAEFECLKDSGYGPLDFASRCRLAGREDQYRTIYGIYCLDAHNNVAALADRHIEHGPDGGVAAISFFVGDDEQMTQWRLDLAGGLFADAAAMIHAAFNTGSAEIALLKGRQDAAHAALVAHVENLRTMNRGSPPG